MDTWKSVIMSSGPYILLHPSVFVMFEICFNPGKSIMNDMISKLGQYTTTFTEALHMHFSSVNMLRIACATASQPNRTHHLQCFSNPSKIPHLNLFSKNSDLSLYFLKDGSKLSTMKCFVLVKAFNWIEKDASLNITVPKMWKTLSEPFLNAVIGVRDGEVSVFDFPPEILQGALINVSDDEGMDEGVRDDVTEMYSTLEYEITKSVLDDNGDLDSFVQVFNDVLQDSNPMGVEAYYRLSHCMDRFFLAIRIETNRKSAVHKSKRRKN